MDEPEVGGRFFFKVKRATPDKSLVMGGAMGGLMSPLFVRSLMHATLGPFSWHTQE